jgi:NADH dehydrogenase FAD-containing subunit
VVVCGGGLTGIEIATEIADAHPRLRTQLVSARPPGGWMSPRARDYLDSTFDTLGVDVLDGVRVERVDPGGLVGTDGVTRPFDLCVWATGFTVPDLARTSGLAVAPNGRALVDATLRSISHPDVYVIGDAAAVAGTWGTQLAMGCRSGGLTAPAVADVITARLSGAEPRPFRYRYFHECVSLGRRRGLVQFLAEDETPKDRVLTGRKALWYKDIVLHAARVYLRHPGPYTLRRRRRRPPSAIASSPGSRRGA